MPDYRSMYDSEWLYAWCLGGRDRTLTIAEVEAVVVENKEKKKEKKPRVRFSELLAKNPPDKRALLLNKTNGATIAAMYGVKTEDWIGKRITLYSADVVAFGQAKEAIRIRPTIPKAKGSSDVIAAENAPAPEVPEEFRDENGHGAGE